MGRRSVACLVAGLALLTAAPAWAGDLVAGHGFRLQAPPGFERVETPGGPSDPSRDLPLTHGLAVQGKVERHVFVAGSSRHPDAVLLACRIDLDESAAVHGARGLRRYLMDNLHRARASFDTLVADEDVTLETAHDWDMDAVEMSHPALQGPLGLAEPAVRAVAVDAGDHLVVVLLQVTDEHVVPPDSLWSRVRGSLAVESRAAVARTALLYGGIAVLVLILLVLFMRRAAGARARQQAALVPARAPAGRTTPARRAAGAPSLPSAPASAARPSAAAAPPAPGPAAPARPGIAQTVPAAPAATPAPGPEEGMRLPRRELSRGPARKGLQRTLPPEGRYSD